MQGFVWLDEPITIITTHQLPILIISEDISTFKYTHLVGSPSGVCIAPILMEMFRLGLPDVYQFVLADDDTMSSTKNLMRALKKYDPNELYYIGQYVRAIQRISSPATTWRLVEVEFPSAILCPRH